MKKFDYLVVSILGALLVALGLIVWAGDQVGARVVGTTPLKEAGARPRIGLEFGQAMNQASVESAFVMEPPVAGQFKWEKNQLWFLPSDSLQAGVSYTAKVRAGAKTADGQALKREVTWQFKVRSSMLLYISPANDDRELWRSQLDGSEAKALTKTGGKVYDFAASPDGERIVYSVVNDKTGTDLWVMTREGAEAKILVSCGSDRCSTPAWSPDSLRLAYSREPAGIAPGAPNGAPRVWTADATTGQTAPLFKDPQLIGYNPTWSPNGNWLAFFDGNNGNIHAINVITTDQILLKSTMGVSGSWSPDSRQLFFTDFTMGESQPAVTVYAADFKTNEVNVILGVDSPYADYGVPAFTLDGNWIAIGLRTQDSGASKQIWLMHPNAQDARAITDTPNYTHGAYQWDATSKYLVFQRYELGVPFAKPEISVWSLESNAPLVLIRDASLPAWLP